PVAAGDRGGPRHAPHAPLHPARSARPPRRRLPPVRRVARGGHAGDLHARHRSRQDRGRPRRAPLGERGALAGDRRRREPVRAACRRRGGGRDGGQPDREHVRVRRRQGALRRRRNARGRAPRGGRSRGGKHMYIIPWVLFGLFVGLVAKLLMGHQPTSLVLTALLGIGGALVGGFVGRALGLYPSHRVTGGVLTSVLGAV